MLEQTPTQPLRILIPHEADEVMSYVLRKYRSAHRVELHNGIHYITVTDEAVLSWTDYKGKEQTSNGHWKSMTRTSVASNIC